jgi:hypothetical protein
MSKKSGCKIGKHVWIKSDLWEKKYNCKFCDAFTTVIPWNERKTRSTVIPWNERKTRCKLGFHVNPNGLSGEFPTVCSLCGKKNSSILAIGFSSFPKNNFKLQSPKNLNFIK